MYIDSVGVGGSNPLAPTEKPLFDTILCVEGAFALPVGQQVFTFAVVLVRLLSPA